MMDTPELEYAPPPFESNGLEETAVMLERFFEEGTQQILRCAVSVLFVLQNCTNQDVVNWVHP